MTMMIMKLIYLLLLLMPFTCAYLFPKSLATFSKRATSRTRPHSSLEMMAGGGEFDWKGVKKQTDEKMMKCMESLQQQFATVRAGGANPALLDRVTVDYYGSQTPLSQVARITVSGAQSLIVDPFEKQLLKEIEKAILTSKLNLTPTNDGTIVRINLPPLTEERRKELVKMVKTMAEDGKVAIRNVRRDFNEKIKAAEKDKLISKDMSKDYQDELQKMVDDYNKKVDNAYKAKEKDLLKV